jgi:hypothetical protein
MPANHKATEDGASSEPEGSAKKPPKGKFVRGVLYVAAKAATHKEFQPQDQNPHPSKSEESGARKGKNTQFVRVGYPSNWAARLMIPRQR